MKFSSINILFFIYIAIICNCVTGFCGKNDMSCTHQLFDERIAYRISEEACFVKHFKVNSPECHLLELGKSEISNNIDYGNVKLKAYVSEYFAQTVFKIYFYNITWSHAKMKYSKNGKELQKNLCRTYEIWKNVTVPLTSKLMNNCSFSRSDYEGEDYVFEYELDKPLVYKKFVFKVPFYSNFTLSAPLNSRQIFSYVDVTNPELLTLHIQATYWKSNVSEYLVELFMEDYNNVSTLIVHSLLPFRGEPIHFTHSVFKKSAKYYFSVAAVSPECNGNICLKTLTPKIFVQHFQNTWALASCMGILFIVIILGVFLPGLIYLKNKRKKTKILVRKSAELPAKYEEQRHPLNPSENFEYDIQKLPM